MTLAVLPVIVHGVTMVAQQAMVTHLASAQAKAISEIMTPEARLTGLLHISAVVAVISLAFLGLDRSHLDEPNFTTGAKIAKIRAKKVLARLDFDRTQPIRIFGARALPMRFIFAVAIICLIASEKIPLSRPLAAAHVCIRQRKVPLFVYLTSWNHIGVIATVAIIANAVLFFGGASILWSWSWPATALGGWIIKGLFIFLFFCLVWIIITGAAMRRLGAERLSKLCRGLGIWVNRETTTRLKKKQAEEVENFLLVKQNLEELHSILQRQLDYTAKRLANMKSPPSWAGGVPPGGGVPPVAPSPPSTPPPVTEPPPRDKNAPDGETK